MAEIAREVHTDGYRTVVVKAIGRPDEDIARVRTVRNALPTSCRIRVDCNGGYTREGAMRFLRGIADMGLEFVEQPVAGDDIEGMRRCRDVGVPISADESLNTPSDALALIQAAACDVLNIKVPKVGGLMLSRHIASVAAAAGIPVVVGGRTTLEISRYASRHFAAATPGTSGRGHEGPGPASQALSDDVVSVRTTRALVRETGGYVRVERTPGLGADVDWRKVERYAVR
jgi:L-alanine-DL-glutamate epimerase-like enolase superfamily enzyme